MRYLFCASAGYIVAGPINIERTINNPNNNHMSKEREGKAKSDKTAALRTPKEKKAAKRAKRDAKNRAE
jgi:hypothetical protein